MNVLVLYAHPAEASFGASLHRHVVGSLVGRGHAVDDCDLYAEGFDPVMSRSDLMLYRRTGENEHAVQPYVERLRRADALVLCFPVWNYGVPAILKGFFDRIFVPGVSFDFEDGRIAPRLRHIRKLLTVTSYGGSRWTALAMGDPPRRLVMRWLRGNIRIGAPAHYLAHYAMNRSTDASRSAFLEQVGRRMERF